MGFIGALRGTAAIIALLSGCATYNPNTLTTNPANIDTSGPLMVSTRTEQQTQQQAYQVFNTVRSVSGEMCQQAKVDCSRIGFQYIPLNHPSGMGKEVNAFYQDGNIYVTGMMAKFMLDEHQMAAVISHEFGHHLAGHGWKTKARVTAGSVLGGLAGGVLGGLTGNPYILQQGVNIGAGLGAGMGRLAFSVDQEKEADYVGAYLMNRAGYDLDKGGEVWVNLAKLKATKQKMSGVEVKDEKSFFSTHPTFRERMGNWHETAREIKANPTSLPKLQ